MAYQHILLDISNGIGRLTLNRPARLNSFTIAMHLEVRAALARLRADKSVRVLVLGAAGRAFCAGHDMADTARPPRREPDDDAGIVDKYFAPPPDADDGAADGGADLSVLVSKYYAPLVLALRALPFPVICAVNGVAAGAGANIALACDIVIAGRSASFIQSFCKLGLVPDTGGSHFLPRLVGPARAAGLALMGDKLSAERAESWGLIWKCVEDEALAAEVDALATYFAGAATLGLARTKQALQASATNTLESQLALECEFMRELGSSADYHEGVAAFVEKRPPQFTGRAGPRTRARPAPAATPAATATTATTATTAPAATPAPTAMPAAPGAPRAARKAGSKPPAPARPKAAPRPKAAAL